MTAFLVLVILILKHGALVHFVDFGYSRSRSPNTRCWYIGLLTHSAMEAVATFLILGYAGYGLCLTALAMESLALAVSCGLERRAGYHNLLRIHLLGEALVLVTYCILVLGCSSTS